MCGVVDCVRVWLACLARRSCMHACAAREVHHDASISLLLKEFKMAHGVDQWRPYEVTGFGGRKFARTAMGFQPRSADGRRVRRRRG